MSRLDNPLQSIKCQNKIGTDPQKKKKKKQIPQRRNKKKQCLRTESLRIRVEKSYGGSNADKKTLVTNKNANRVHASNIKQ